MFPARAYAPVWPATPPSSPHHAANGWRVFLDTPAFGGENRGIGWKSGLCGDATQLATPLRRSEPPRPRVRPARANLRPADTAFK